MNEEYETREFWNELIKIVITDNGNEWESISVKLNGVELKGITTVTYKPSTNFDRYI